MATYKDIPLKLQYEFREFHKMILTKFGKVIQTIAVSLIALIFLEKKKKSRCAP